MGGKGRVAGEPGHYPYQVCMRSECCVTMEEPEHQQHQQQQQFGGPAGARLGRARQGKQW